MSINNIGTQGFKAISEAMMNNHSMTELNIGNNQIECSKELSNILRTAITNIDIRSNNIKKEGITLLFTQVQHNITYLCLKNNSIGSDSIKIIASHLARIKELDISQNNIDKIGAMAISQALCNNTSLTALSNAINTK